MGLRDRILERLKSDDVVTWIGVITAVLVVVILGLAAIYGPSILTSTSAVQDGNDLAGCRSSYNADVTDRRTDFDLARSRRDSAAAALDVLNDQITEEAIFGSQEAVEQLRDDLPIARKAVTDAELEVDDAEEALEQANDVYQAAVKRSREDPEGFLAECRGGNV